MQQFNHHLHVANLVREEFDNSLVSANLAQLDHNQEEGFDLGGHLKCLRSDGLADVDFEEVHDGRDDGIEDGVEHT